MVRPLLATLIGLLAACPAGAQSVDWNEAGGGLFGPIPQTSGSHPASPSAHLVSQPFRELVDAAAAAHGLDPKLLHALIIAESGYRVDAVSPAGAAGLTQLMPATARELGVVDRLDPAQNVNGGAAYLARQILAFGDLRLALAAYNAGPARVARLGRVPEIVETEAYIDAVIECFLALSAGRVVVEAPQCRGPASPDRSDLR